MIAYTAAANMDTKSGDRMEITVSDGTTVAHPTEFPSREPSVGTSIKRCR